MLRDLIRHLPTEVGIYIITNQVNGKVYIGQAQGKLGIYQRCKSHIERLRSGKDSRHLQASWDKYGPRAFKFESLLLCPQDQCDRWEQCLILTFHSWKREIGYNIEISSKGPGRLSNETKFRIAESHKGKPGRKWTDEQRRAASDARKGVWGVGTLHSEITKEKMSKTHSGRPKSEQAKRRLSEARKGIEIHPEAIEKRAKTMGKSRWMNNGVKTSIIPEAQIQEYVEKGWVFGRVIDLPRSSFEISIRR